ncbi:sensor histidine kinase [bacterium]|nr:sensor histidine kinase [bacterium]NBX72224.1 sensor histidine kinase [bacterium]
MDADKLKIKSSIAQKLLTIVFSFYVVITVIVTIYHMYTDYASTSQRIHEQLDSTLDLVSVPLAESLWNYNGDDIKAVIKVLTEAKVILGALVEDDQTQQWKGGFIPSDDQGNFTEYDSLTGKAKSNPQFIADPFAAKKELIYQDASGKNLKIGQITLYTSAGIVLDQVKEVFLVIIVNSFLKSTALWVLFLIFGKRYLTKPLTDMTDATLKVASGNLERTNITKDKKWPTEIDVLSDNFEAMTERLLEGQAKIIATQLRLRDIIDSMPSMILGINSKGEVTEWNKEMARFTNISPEQAVGKEFLTLYQSYSFLLPIIAKVLENKTLERIPNQVVYVNQHRSYQDIILYPIVDNDNVSIIIRIDDVTHRINMERAMVQTEKMSSVGALAAGMAHEINTPLANILQGSQNIMRRIDPTMEANQKAAQELGLDLNLVMSYFNQRKISTFIDAIKESAEKASKTVANLLQFSNQSSSAKTACSFAEMIDQSLELAATDYDLKQNTDFKTVEIIKDIPADLPKVYASSTDINQVILNLIKVSCQSMMSHAKKQIIKIKLSLENSKVKLELSDNGPGLDEETQKKIFEPFFTSKNIGEGVSLGLSVSYKIIVDSHKGDLTISSGENAGTTFTVMLPVATV